MFVSSQMNFLLRKGAAASLLFVAALAFFPAAGSVEARDKGELVAVADTGGIVRKPLNITLGKADMVDVGADVSDVMVADPSLIDVQAIQSNRLYIVGLKVGDTNVIALDDKGNVVKRIDVHVTYDLQAIQSLIDEIFPKENVKIGSIHDQILLTGTVSNPNVASRIANLVGHYVGDLQDESKTIDELVSNLLDVRGEQQVMLQVRIVEAARNALKELGIETGANNNLSSTTSRGDLVFFGSGGGIALSQDPVGVAGALVESGIRGLGQIALTLNALEEQNLVNILAEPNLTAVSGEEAGFLAGGEFPVPVGRDQVGNIVIEFRSFGVSLNFRPVVLSDSRISMQMKTEVSSLDFSTPLSSGDLVIPGLDVRRADTTVEIPSGGSLVIAGLLQSENIKNMSGLPGISKAPVLGRLLSSEGFTRNETELVVIVTPYLVEPFAEKERVRQVSSSKHDAVPVLPSGGVSSSSVNDARPLPPQGPHSAPISGFFADNVRRVYRLKDAGVFASDGRFGYLLD